MKKILTMLLLALAPMLFVACDDDEDYYRHPEWVDDGPSHNPTTGELNAYERNLVGSYVSDDDPSSVYYFVFNSDRTGSYSFVEGGQTGGESFRWGAGETSITFVYDSDGRKNTVEYYYKNGHLYIDGIALVANTGQGQQPSDNPLVSQWEGKIEGFYSAMYNLDDDKHATVCEFTANGEGVQLDYDPTQPKTNYAYTPFTWSKAANVIEVNYVENALPTAIFRDYALSATTFTGTVNYGTDFFTFGYKATSGFDWTPYMTGQGVSEAKTRLGELRRAKSGPVRSGTFAR